MLRSNAHFTNEQVANDVYRDILDRRQMFFRDSHPDVHDDFNFNSLEDFYDMVVKEKMDELDDVSAAFKRNLMCVLTAYKSGLATYVGDEVLLLALSQV